MRRFPIVASGLVAAAAVALGCGDDPTAPERTQPPAETPMPLGLSEEERASIGAAVSFAGAHSVKALQQRNEAARVAAAFAELARRVEAGDRAGTHRAISATSAAVKRYRDIAKDAAAAADLEAMDLTLERAASLSAEAAVRIEPAPSSATTTRATSATLRQEPRP